MAGFFQSSSNSRLSYKVAKEALLKAGISPERAKLTQSYLRFEAIMSASVTTYNLGVLVNQPSFNAGASGAPTTFNTERKLNLQDSFICDQMGVFLGVSASVTDSSAMKLVSFPDPTIITTANAAAAAYGLYSGWASLNVDQQNISPYWDLQRHLVIPNTNVGGTTTAATGFNQSELNGQTQGFAPVQPCWIFNGKQNIQFNLNLPAAISTVQASSLGRIVVILRGHLAQNVGINQQY